MRLLDAEDFAGGGLRQVAPLDEAVNLEGELCLQQFLLGTGRPRSAKTLPLLFSTRIGLVLFVAISIFPSSVASFGLGEALMDKVAPILPPYIYTSICI
ncbi:MAG: hypothetical protein WBX02_07470, partial [Terriglobales bacterium]